MYVMRGTLRSVWLGAGGTLILIGASLAALACASPDTSHVMTEAQLVEIARNTPEGREFYMKFPAAVASVDRSGRLAVDFRGSSARLRLFIVNGAAAEPFLDCPPGTVHTRDVVSAIRGCG